MNNKIYVILIGLIPFLVDFTGIPSWSCYPLIILIGILGKSRINLKEWDGFTAAVFILTFVGLFRMNQYSLNLFKDLGLMLIGIFPFILNAKFRVDVNYFNVLVILGFLLSAGSALFGFHMSIENFLDSSFGVEKGAAPYTLGLLVIYWAQKRNYIWVAVDIFFMILGGKRIALVAVAAGILIWFLFRNRHGKTPVLFRIGLFGIAAGYVALSFLFVTGVFDDWFLEYTQRSANSFTMGRQMLYQVVFSITPHLNLWGIGPGNTVEALTNYLEIPRMHNDFLKIYSEDGIILFVVFFFMFLRKMSYQQLPTVVLIYFFFATTNTLIYTYMLFMYCLFLNPDKYLYGSVTQKRRKRKIFFGGGA